MKIWIIVILLMGVILGGVQLHPSPFRSICRRNF